MSLTAAAVAAEIAVAAIAADLGPAAKPCAVAVVSEWQSTERLAVASSVESTDSVAVAFQRAFWWQLSLEYYWALVAQRCAVRYLHVFLAIRLAKFSWSMQRSSWKLVPGVLLWRFYVQPSSSLALLRSMHVHRDHNFSEWHLHRL